MKVAREEFVATIAEKSALGKFQPPTVRRSCSDGFCAFIAAISDRKVASFGSTGRQGKGAKVSKAASQSDYQNRPNARSPDMI